MSSVRPEPLSEGRFQLIEVIGEGGMATVYRAFDQRLQRPRAIKVLSPALAMRPQLRRRFLAEAQTMATLEESRVVRVFDMGEDGDRVFIVMELVEGGSLLDRVRDHGPLPPRMAAEVTAQLADSLQAAHDAGVIHRDIKPHNVLLTRSGEIRITDFGIAQVQHEGDSGMTKTGAVLGTWGFMAPEQKSNAKTVDARADVYSVGATLWALLRNEVPPELFMADNEPSMLEGIDDALAEVIKRATRYRREERYPNARTLAEALRAIGPHLPDDPPDTVGLVRPPQPGTDSDPTDTMMHFRSTQEASLAADGTMIPEVGETPAPATQPPLSDLRAPTAFEEPPPSERRWWPLAIAIGGAALGLVTVLSFWPESPEPAPLPVPAPVEPKPDPHVDVVVPVPEPDPQPGPAPDDVADPPPVKPGVPGKPKPDKPPDDLVVAPDPIPVPAIPPVKPPPVEKATFVHSSPATAKLGESLTFTATFPGSHALKLYYRGAGMGAYKEKDMRLDGGAYSATVKIDDSMSGGLEYYIAEVNGAAKTPRSGSGFRPVKVAVE